jgi:hypothetical protein
MTELDISKNRLCFPAGKQRKFIKTCLDKLGYKNNDAAERLSVSIRSITDWKREKFSISASAAKTLSRLSGIKIPRNAKKLDEFWYTSKGGVAGARAVLEKYGHIGGDPEERRKRWREWWKNEGQFKEREIFRRKPVIKPKKDKYLAEFVGIMLGDGGITKSQVTITLNRETDRDYVVFVRKMVKELFGVDPSILKDKFSLAVDIVVSRVDLVDFCRSIGLKIGNKIKQGADIPNWVKTNNNFMKSCIRGLVDTDGCFFTHKYISKGKFYKYKKIDFASCSKPLLNSVFVFLKNIGLRPRIVRDGKKIRIESIDTVRRYLEVIGTSNPKHLMRYKH